MKPATMPTEELMGSGHLACQGCGATQAMRFALKALGPDTALVIPACCWAVIDGSFPHSCIDLPIYHTAFETAAVVASGLKAGLEMRGDTKTTVMAWAGAAVLIQDEALFKTPDSLTQPVIIRFTQYRFVNDVIQWLNVNLVGRGLTYAQLVYWVVLMLVGFLLLVILYGIIYRLIGPPKYGPLDSPPLKKGSRR